MDGEQGGKVTKRRSLALVPLHMLSVRYQLCWHVKKKNKENTGYVNLVLKKEVCLRNKHSEVNSQEMAAKPMETDGII